MKQHIKNIVLMVLINLVVYILLNILKNLLMEYVAVFKSIPCIGVCLAYYYGPTPAQMVLNIATVVVGIILTITLTVKLLKIKFIQSIIYYIIALIISYAIFLLSMGLFQLIRGY